MNEKTFETTVGPVALDWHGTVVKLLDPEPDYGCPYSMARAELIQPTVDRIHQMQDEGYYFVVITGARLGIKHIIESQALAVFKEPVAVFTQEEWHGMTALADFKKDCLKLTRACLFVDDMLPMRAAGVQLGIPSISPEEFARDGEPWVKADLGALKKGVSS